MPELSFVLPHWLYWSGLIVFPLTMLLLYRVIQPKTTMVGKSLPLAYALLLFSGFIGAHRMYLQSRLAWLFVTVFISILLVNVQVRDARNALSSTDNEVSIAQYELTTAKKELAEEAQDLPALSQAKATVNKATSQLALAQSEKQQAQAHYEARRSLSQGLGVLSLLLILVDGFLLVGLVAKINQNLPHLQSHPPHLASDSKPPEQPSRFLFFQGVAKINDWIGEFVAYWSLIAVGVYYYEVMARYVFNSPTNWAHESMFLMFGMQYLLAGGFVLREGGHVRVDVLYMRFSRRTKAMVDVLTSVFFFMFMLALVITGWTFFLDSYRVQEVSFTEWGISYWPIKFALPLGAFLLCLQGIAQLIENMAIAIRSDRSS